MKKIKENRAYSLQENLIGHRPSFCPHCETKLLLDIAGQGS